MKKVICTIALLMILSAIPYSLDAQSGIGDWKINIDYYGKSGAVIKPDGSYKLCPGFAFRCCAVVTITVREAWDYLFSSSPDSPGSSGNLPSGQAIVKLYDENGNLYATEIMQAELINLPQNFEATSSSPSAISIQQENILLR